MGVWALLITIIDLLYYNDLLASLTTLENDCNLGFRPLIVWPTGRKESEVLFRACKLEESVSHDMANRKTCQ
jgi:hypothetical protein